MTEKKVERFAYVKNPHGATIDIPERHLKQTLDRAGFTFVGWADDAQKEMDELFSETDVGYAADDKPENKGAYQRSQQSEQAELDNLNNSNGLTYGVQNTSNKKKPKVTKNKKK